MGIPEYKVLAVKDNTYNSSTDAVIQTQDITRVMNEQARNGWKVFSTAWCSQFCYMLITFVKE